VSPFIDSVYNSKGDICNRKRVDVIKQFILQNGNAINALIKTNVPKAIKPNP
jgi:hypothetical protein